MSDEEEKSMGSDSAESPDSVELGSASWSWGRTCSISEERDDARALRLPRTVSVREARVKATYRRLRLSTVF